MSFFDISIIVIYMISMILIGIACRGKQVDESDYFTGHGGFSSFLGSIIVGLSIAATFFSGISMFAYPSLAFQKGITILTGVFLLPVAAVIAGGWFLPRYLKTGTKEPYEIIERKFGLPTRMAAAWLFLTLRIAWMGTLIYAPTSALVGGFGLSQFWFWIIVVGIGVSSTVYTVLGGIRGVIVTDAIQFLVMIGGILLPVIVVWQRLEIGWSDAFHYLQETGRLNLMSFSLDVTEPLTFWSMLCGFTVGNLGLYIADQMALQRYLASNNMQEARKAFVINIAGVLIVIMLLVVMGLSLALFYGLVKPDQLPGKADAVFPHFLATELPPGTAGLIFAAILAATMSSMTSGINALAGTIVMDLNSRTSWLTTSRQRLRFAKIISLAIGLFSTCVAGLVGYLGSIFEIAQSLTGVFLGPLLACMLLAVSPRQYSPRAVRWGMGLGIIAGWGVIISPADKLWVGPVATIISAGLPLVERSCRSLLWRNHVEKRVVE